MRSQPGSMKMPKRMFPDNRRGFPPKVHQASVESVDDWEFYGCPDFGDEEGPTSRDPFWSFEKLLRLTEPTKFKPIVRIKRDLLGR